MLKSQTEKLVTVGIDMGVNLWACGFFNWFLKKYSYKGYRGDSKELNCYEKVKQLIQEGYRVHVFYEAGRNGFTPARFLKSLGADVTILPVSKLTILKSGKKVKTDRIDARFLSELHPEDNLPSVHIPTVAEESKSSLLREQERILTDIKRKNNQILSILERFYMPKVTTHKSSSMWLKILSGWDKLGLTAKGLPKVEQMRIYNLIEEIKVLEKNLESLTAYIETLEKEEREEENSRGKNTTIDKIMQFKGNAETIARKLSWHIGSFDRFKNGKSISSYFGLCSVPWSSGKINRDQGISKSGRRELRRIAIEMAWLWKKWQPDCELVKKWAPRLETKGRNRKTAIVALARQLIVALYRNIVYGEEIKGAIINNPLKVF